MPNAIKQGNGITQVLRKPFDIEEMIKEMQTAVNAGVMEMDKFIAEVRHSAEDGHPEVAAADERAAALGESQESLQVKNLLRLIWMEMFNGKVPCNRIYYQKGG